MRIDGFLGGGVGGWRVFLGGEGGKADGRAELIGLAGGRTPSRAGLRDGTGFGSLKMAKTPRASHPGKTPIYELS